MTRPVFSEELPSDLDISWQRPWPAVLPTSVVTWQLASSENWRPSALESRLQWPPYTLAILEEALQRGLSRFQGWALAPALDRYFLAFLQASRVYKRGCGLLGAQEPARQQGRYPIRFFSGSLMQLCSQLPSGPVVVDRKLLKLYPLATWLSGRGIIEIAAEERYKNLETVANLLAAMSKNSSGPLIIVGGGLTSDCAGFAAALAGRQFIYVPTTLLAMTDASIGGKTSVNHSQFGKNQIGSFAFPREVIISTAWLKTLDSQQWRSGLAEVIKHCILSGDWERAKRLVDPSTSTITPLELQPVIAVKARVVAEDTTEQGFRAVLNYGHTMGHALETLSQQETPLNPLSHGEAIALGMLFATQLAIQLGHQNRSDLLDLRCLLKTADFPLSEKRLSPHFKRPLQDPSVFPHLMTLLERDKKAHDGQTYWILLHAAGKFVTQQGRHRIPVSAASLKHSWKSFVHELSKA